MKKLLSGFVSSVLLIVAVLVSGAPTIARAQTSGFPACGQDYRAETVPDPSTGNPIITGYIDNSTNASCQPSQQQLQQTGKELPNVAAALPEYATPDAACNAAIGSWSSFFTPSCWGPLISGVVSGALVYAASWLLTAAGFLFDWTLNQTILNFGALVNADVIQGINTAWTVGRDISNILIIGLFTFIAIATILGNTEYGVRRMLARVLIIAVLINFSLLFAKLIIDVSNFTAGQFYTAAQGVIGQPEGATTVNAANANTVQSAGVAGAFMKYAGVSSFGDTTKAVGELAKKQNSWIALIFGIVTALLFVVAAIVLLYGTFLLVTRALVLVFLMITASLAFATYLWPKLSEGGYGWNAWWNALLKNAVFAPLLMFFLWVSLTLGAAFSASAGSLGQLIINPESTVNISALLGYVIVIGLLFASLKLSSSFASSVSGLNLGQYAFDLGRSRLGGLAWQQTVGRFAYNRERAATTNARVASHEAENIRRRAETLGSLSQADKVKLKELDTSAARNSRRANTFGSLSNKPVGGVQGFGGGIGKPPSATREVKGAQARAGNAAETQATPAQAPQAQQNPQMDELIKQQRELNSSIASAEKERTEISKQHTEAFNKLIESNKEAAEAQKTIASEGGERKQIEDKHSEEMIKKQIETATANMSPEKRAEVEHDIRRNSEEQRASELRHQGEKIEQAQAKLTQLTESDPMLSELQKRLKEVDEKLGVNRTAANQINGKILELQNNAPASAPEIVVEQSTASSSATESAEVSAFRGANKRVVRTEIFRPQTTDVTAHAEIVDHDKPLPIQNQQKAA
ncbi:MAG TPA: hypothetical protein VMU25_02335 [Candidatus Paceibacterota bacterium]|nr:hypothetical protein [Candidatus Paceibacterota bacterium]